MNHIVLLTGAASGLGLSLAKRLVGRGDTVYGVTRSKRHWKAAKEQISSPQKFILSQVDVSRELQVKRLVSRVHREAGKIDVLINNAGYVNPLTRVEEESLKEFQKNFSHNLTSTFLMCKYTIPLFRKQRRGWIVNIASMAGKRAVPRLGAYSASKSGVLALSQVIAKENQETGFQCVTVCPGGMNTQMRARIFGKEDAERQQSPDFVAEKILEILDGKTPVPSGGDVVIRHGRVASINPPPEA